LGGLHPKIEVDAISVGCRGSRSGGLFFGDLAQSADVALSIAADLEVAVLDVIGAISGALSFSVTG
jgi:hypothetical protein